MSFMTNSVTKLGNRVLKTINKNNYIIVVFSCIINVVYECMYELCTSIKRYQDDIVSESRSELNRILVVPIKKYNFTLLVARNI